jgi:hypothetical protein
MNESPPPENAQGHPARWPRKSVKKLLRRRPYRKCGVSASLRQDVSDYIAFARHVIRTGSTHLLPMALQCLEAARRILEGESV